MSRTFKLGQAEAEQNKGKREIRLLELLANNATGASRKFLIRHGKDGKGVKNAQELEEKMAEVWNEGSDKIAIEAELAQIHPHKDIILKHCAPAVTQAAEKPVEETIKEVVVDSGSSSCDGGKCNCSCKKSNACGCSGFDGPTSTTNNTPIPVRDNGIIVIGAISALGVLGLVAIALAFKKS